MKTVESPPVPLPGGQVWPLSIAGYRALGEAGLIPKNTELLYGFVYRKMSKSPLHAALVGRLLRLIQAVLPKGYWLRSEQPITCGDSEPEPDISVLCGSEEDFWEDHPHTAELVVEICLTSHDFDRSKLRAYATAKVRECWLVLAPEKQIEVYRRPVDGTYTDFKTYGPGGKLTGLALPQFTVDLDVLFVN
jgi:Uma2 family endonuclease